MRVVYAQLADAMPPYEALSYSVGDPGERGVLRVRVAGGDTWELSATTSLLAALRRLRRIGGEERTRTL